MTSLALIIGVVFFMTILVWATEDVFSHLLLLHVILLALNQALIYLLCLSPIRVEYQRVYRSMGQVS
jgi:hypothetical protein